MGLLTWWRLLWKQYTCPHDDIENISYFLGTRSTCRQCGLVWEPKPAKGQK